MENSFVIDSFRFHAKERNKFLVKGWFEDESQVSEHQLEVWLDGIELDKSIEKSVNTGIALFPKKDGETPVWFYSVWITLPENFEEAKTLKVVDRYQGEEKVVYKISGPKLKKKQMRLDKFIEGGRITEDGFKIRGWCIRLEKVTIKVCDALL